MIGAADPHLRAAPWHDGERILQSQTGMRQRMEERGRVVLRSYMPDQHLQFFCGQERMFLALADSTGMPWATLIEADVGFISAPSATRLDFAAALPAGDPAAGGLADGAMIGALGLEFATRRRNRVNGIVRRAGHSEGFALDVRQSFGNCAQYIQAREPAPTGTAFRQIPDQAPARSASLSQQDRDLIAACDTFFIATRSGALADDPALGLDISHRGGLPGFVTVEGSNRISFPDYRGNFFFNSLGNLLSDPRCGLLFIDFATGTTLQLTGIGEVATKPQPGTSGPAIERTVAINIDAVVRHQNRLRAPWVFRSFAPQFSAQTRNDSSFPGNNTVELNAGEQQRETLSA